MKTVNESQMVSVALINLTMIKAEHENREERDLLGMAYLSCSRLTSIVRMRHQL